MIITEVWVPGVPRTKGSVTPKGRYVADTEHSKRWRAFVAERVRFDVELRQTYERTFDAFEPYAGPVVVEIVSFCLPSANQRVEHPIVPLWNQAGDVDKFARNVLDAIAADATSAIMNGGAIVNDNQVQRVISEKWTCDAAIGPGQIIRCTTQPPFNLEWYRNEALARLNDLR